MKKYGKHTILGWSWRTLLWVVLTPIVLFALAAALIYFPPVQKWAVDKAAESLSEEMGMDVTVENVRLKFPLDLSMGGMLAIQEGDTVLNAEELRLSVQVRPLFDKQVNVDDIILRNADINTRGLIDAVLIKGHVGELQAYTHGVDLNKENVVVNKLALRDADLQIALPDTVPPDTAVTEPTKWKLDLQDVNLQKVKFALSLAQEKGYSIEDLYKQKSVPKDLDTYFDKASLSAYIDLENGKYSVTNLKASGSKARFQDSFDGENLQVECDSIHFVQEPMDLYVNINQMSGKEKCGINFKDVHGRVLMDSENLTIPGMTVLTDDSEIEVDMAMNLNTFDDEEPGTMTLNLKSTIGKSDAMLMTRYVDRFLSEDAKLDAVREMIQQYMPVKPTPFVASLSGNLQDLHLDKIYTNVDGIGKFDGSVRMQGDKLLVDAHGILAGGEALVDGEYDMANESYDVDLDLHDFNVNKYVDLPEQTRITGVVSAKGKGFDIYSPATKIDASANIRKGHYGKINLGSIKADVALAKQVFDVDMTCNNEQLVTSFNLTGKVNKSLAEGTLDIDLPYIDLKSMGYADDKLVVKTQGKFDFKTNMNDQFYVDSYVNGLDVETTESNLHTDDFDLLAESTSNSTTAHLVTGDMKLDFDAPQNIFKLMAQGEKLQTVFMKQAKKREINFEVLRSYMPLAKLNVTSGSNNPLTTFLAANGISFSDASINLDASPESGLLGNGYINNLQKDSISIDKIFFDIHQDANNIVFESGVEAADQPLIPAFKASLDGYFSSRVADVHVKYFDKDNVKGVDLGAHVVGLDSVWHLTMYPEKPIIAYHQFELADTSFVDFYREEGHPIIGDVKLKSLTDDCDISITGLDNEGEQRALVEVNNFNLEGVAKIMPLMPKMSGLFSIDAAYQENGGKFWVDAMTDIANFVYEGMPVGNIGSMFTYEPEDENLSIHTVEGDISYEGIDVATLRGRYDGTGEGNLDANLKLHDYPMQMLSAFVPDQLVTLAGTLGGEMSVKGPTDKLEINGFALPEDVIVSSPYYSFKLRLDNDTLAVADSKIAFDKYKMYGAGENPLTLDGYVNFSDMDRILLSLQVAGRNVKFIDSKRTAKSVMFGDGYGDFFARMTGDTDDVKVRGYLNVSANTNLTYIMSDATISQGDRLDDIVTFVNFELPPDTTVEREINTLMGIDMKFTLNVEDGAKFRAEFSADKQSYVNVRGGGQIVVNYTPEGVMNTQGRLTVSEGEMKYTLPVIPLKTFKIQNGSYIEFTGDMFNPTLNISAVERTKAQVSSDGGSARSVEFNVGLDITQTLNDMGLAFTISAPLDAQVQEELGNCSDDELNKLAVALLATGMYVSDTNSSAITANNALSSFLQSQINNIAGRALGSIVDVSLGMDQQTYSNGMTGNDYTFKFSKRFFSDRLSVVIGGRVSDNNSINKQTDIGSFIDDVSLEWRLDDSATRYVRLFHCKDYDNIFEGVLEKNGGGVVLRKKLSNISDIIFWKKNNTEAAEPARVEERRKESER